VTSSANWTQGAVLPATFTVRLNFTKQTMQAGPLVVPIHGGDRSHPFFQGGGITLSLSLNGSTGRWSYSSATGRAEGTLRKVA
jgi:hypothetical protein